MSPIVTLLSKFPIKSYPPEDIRDTPLENELSSRTYYYGMDDGKRVNFTLFIGEYGIDDETGVVYAMDPDCLFIQCMLGMKQGLELPRDENPIKNAKIISVKTNDLPMLMIEDGKYLTSSELLSDIDVKYFHLKERQWCHVLDSVVKPVWIQEQLHGGSDNTEQRYHTTRARDTLQVLEAEYLTTIKQPHHRYFQLKLATLIFAILRGPPTPTQAYINGRCPTLSSLNPLAALSG
ncbi:hypothetical protein MOUN0_H04654 [Monosporozyma unispora]